MGDRGEPAGFIEEEVERLGPGRAGEEIDPGAAGVAIGNLAFDGGIDPVFPIEWGGGTVRRGAEEV